MSVSHRGVMMPESVSQILNIQLALSLSIIVIAYGQI